MYECPLCGRPYATEYQAYRCCIGFDEPNDYEEVIDEYDDDQEEYEEEELWD